MAAFKRPQVPAETPPEMPQGASDGDLASSGSPSQGPEGASGNVQNLLDTMRVFFNNVPQQWQKYITSPYEKGDPKMAEFEQKIAQGFQRMQQQGGQQGTESSQQAASPQDDMSQLGLTPPSGSPVSVSAPGPQSAPTPIGPSPSPASSMPVSSANRNVTFNPNKPPNADLLPKDSTIGDAVAFFMREHNLGRDDAMSAARNWKGEPSVMDRAAR